MKGTLSKKNNNSKNKAKPSKSSFLSKFNKKSKFSENPKFNKKADNIANNSVIDSYNAPETMDNHNFAVTEYDVSTWYSWNGRIGRVQFLAFMAVWMIIMTILGLIAFALIGSTVMAMIAGSADSTPNLAAIGIPAILLFLVFFAIVIYSTIALYRRRLHDLNMSGLWIIGIFVISCIPVVNILQFVAFLYLVFKAGDPGRNQYGNPPSPYTKLESILAGLYVLFPILLVAAGFYLASVFANNMPEDSSFGEFEEMSDISISDDSATSEDMGEWEWTEEAPEVEDRTSEETEIAIDASGQIVTGEAAEQVIEQQESFDEAASMDVEVETSEANSGTSWDAQALIDSALHSEASVQKDAASFEDFLRESDITIEQEPEEAE